ncbi:hypothetical protein BKA70DRAFT_1227536 [Coprinopsis sp. MPI-PUGE-AT-0042]|nr:hypothetical protein BKA70DRAFT_1227536 [Coprinopsis sp. MPI-PUGE-AT-0042]
MADLEDFELTLATRVRQRPISTGGDLNRTLLALDHSHCFRKASCRRSLSSQGSRCDARSLSLDSLPHLSLEIYSTALNRTLLPATPTTGLLGRSGIPQLDFDYDLPWLAPPRAVPRQFHSQSLLGKTRYSDGCLSHQLPTLLSTHGQRLKVNQQSSIADLKNFFRYGGPKSRYPTVELQHRELMVFKNEQTCLWGSGHGIRVSWASARQSLSVLRNKLSHDRHRAEVY